MTKTSPCPPCISQSHYVSLYTDNGVTSYPLHILIHYNSALNARSTTFPPTTMWAITLTTNSAIQNILPTIPQQHSHVNCRLITIKTSPYHTSNPISYLNQEQATHLNKDNTPRQTVTLSESTLTISYFCYIMENSTIRPKQPHRTMLTPSTSHPTSSLLPSPSFPSQTLSRFILPPQTARAMTVAYFLGTLAGMAALSNRRPFRFGRVVRWWKYGLKGKEKRGENGESVVLRAMANMRSNAWSESTERIVKRRTHWFSSRCAEFLAHLQRAVWQRAWTLPFEMTWIEIVETIHGLTTLNWIHGGVCVNVGLQAGWIMTALQVSSREVLFISGVSETRGPYTNAYFRDSYNWHWS